MRQKTRNAIQIIAKKYPNLKNVEIAEVIGTSNIAISRWKNKTNFTDKKRKRKNKMSKDIKIFF